MQNKWIYPLGLIIVLFLAFYFYRKYRVAPELELESLQVMDLNGKGVDITSIKGKKTMLCFGASWCGPCREELKVIHSIKETELSDIDVVVISDEPLERVQAFRDHTNYSFSWLKLKQPFSQIGINSIPTTYLVNADGKVVKKTVGYINWKDPSTVMYMKKLMEQ